MGMRLHQVQRCSACEGTLNDHDEGCPRAQVDFWEERQRRIPCPTQCGGTVGVNKQDYYECRNCGIQFTSGCGAPEGAEKYFLDDPKASDLVMVQVLPNKGSGEFPVDEELKRAQEVLEQALGPKQVTPEDFKAPASGILRLMCESADDGELKIMADFHDQQLAVDNLRRLRDEHSDVFTLCDENGPLDE